MFGGLLNVRLKAAEQALRDGRLDEAIRVVGKPDVRNHKRGEKLAKQLAEAFVERARQHYRAERFTEALLDLTKADACGGAEEKAKELREQVLTVADEVARQEAEKRGRIEEAKRRIYGGSLAAGKAIIGQADADDAGVKKLGQEIEVRSEQSDQLLAEAETLLKQGQLAASAERVLRARELNAHDARVVRLEAAICDKAVAAAHEAIKGGRIGRARTELESLGMLGEHHSGKAELLETLGLVEAAGNSLGRGEFEEAERLVHRLQRLCPKVSWVSEAVNLLGKIDNAMLTLRSGPLGDPASAVVAGKAAASGKRPLHLEDTVVLGSREPAAVVTSLLPRQLLLLVDGGGSYLVDRGGRLSIGRAMSANPADMPIVSDLSERHAEISRVEDDYFLLSPNEVEISGRMTKHQLLRDGDRVVLARRAKFTLRLPNRRSPSARLDLSDSTKMPNDVRKVILFKQTATIGRSASCHIVCHDAGRDLVIFERGGRLWVRPQGGNADERDAKHIELGKPVEIDGLCFTMQPWEVKGPGSMRMA